MPRSVGFGLAFATLLIAMPAVAQQAGPAAAPSWTAPLAESDKKNPLPAEAKTVAQGQKVAQSNCVSCHGTKGKGDGVAAVALNPKPADWTSKKVQGESDGEIFWKITTGHNAMPSWKHLPEQDRWALVRYIRSLGGK
jgi:mono/diheme cytochrome c family protein